VKAMPTKYLGQRMGQPNRLQYWPRRSTLPIRRAQLVKKNIPPTADHLKVLKPPTRRLRCIQPTAPSANLGKPGVILHRHQFEWLTSKRPRLHPRRNTCNLRPATMRDPRAMTINRLLKSSSSLTITPVAITMLHQARTTFLSTLLSPPLCKYLLLVRNTSTCRSRLLATNCAYCA
jgi:hypothetical protein